MEGRSVVMNLFGLYNERWEWDSRGPRFWPKIATRENSKAVSKAGGPDSLAIQAGRGCCDEDLQARPITVTLTTSG